MKLFLTKKSEWENTYRNAKTKRSVEETTTAMPYFIGIAIELFIFITGGMKKR